MKIIAHGLLQSERTLPRKNTFTTTFAVGIHVDPGQGIQHMYGKLDPPLVPKNGHTAKIVLVVRVSDAREGKQDERSLDDQTKDLKGWLNAVLDVPYDTAVLSRNGSGESLESEQYFSLLEIIRGNKKPDAIVSEDLGRILRRIQAHVICELCEDAGIRLIARNDHVDTARPDWRESSIFAAFHHERSNRDTSDRIKRTHRNRFTNGGCLAIPIFGYIKVPGAKGDADLKKDPAAAAVYTKWFEMLDGGASFADVADWLNETGVSVAPAKHKRKRTKWDGKKVAAHTFNPILKGLRQRNRRKTKRHNASGKYRSIKAAPEELLERRVPHLAFFSPEYYDRVVSKVRERNKRYRRSPNPSEDPCAGRPKKRVRFPGQIIVDGICGHPFVFGGHGQKDHLMCTGAREYQCWNGISVDGRLAANKISAAVFSAIDHLHSFDEAFLALIQEEAEKLNTVREADIRKVSTELNEVERQYSNVMAFIRSQGDTASPSLGVELRKLDQELARLRGGLDELRARPTDTVQVPPIETIKLLAREAFADLAVESLEFGRFMRILIPKILVFPYRLCDGEDIVLRARFRLQLSNVLKDKRLRELLAQPLEQVLTVDLFEPPQREKYRAEVVQRRATGQTEREVAQSLSITVTAAQRAMALQRMMDQLGIHDPYVPVTAPANHYGLRRHTHPRYGFAPLPNAGEL